MPTIDSLANSLSSVLEPATAAPSLAAAISTDGTPTAARHLMAPPDA
ncbi:hypothetical protein [Saccharopolyspora spinosa]|nr:hypothetical protein [Saccharopolyspora spinosa]